MPFTKIQLCSQALVMCGASPIASLAGPSAEAIASDQLYEPAVEELIGVYRWRFATRTVLLSRLADAPTSIYEAAYQLPADVLMVHAATVNDHLIEFDRYEGQLHCNARSSDAVYLTYSYRPGEDFWPTYFAVCVRLKLASQFAIAVASNDQLAQVYEGKLIRQLTAARLADAQGRTAAKLPVGNFRAIHGGRP